jgi:hypothetical protein
MAQRIGPHRPRGQAPSHLAVTRTPGRCALDGAPRALAPMRAVLLFFGENRTPCYGAPVPRRFRPRARFTSETSDAPCRVLHRFGNPTRRRARTASAAPSSNESSFPGSERLPSTDAHGIRFSQTPKTRHRSLDFAIETRLPTRFRLTMLSHAKARPLEFSASSSLAGAKGRAPPVDFCNRYDPQARPSDRLNPAHRTGSRLPVQLLSRVATRFTSAAPPCR